MTIKVFEGESDWQDDCLEICETMLENVPAAKLGSLRIRVDFEIDKNGILTVKAN